MSKQLNLDSFGSNNKCSKERSDCINNLMMIACVIHPLDIVNGKGFREVFAYLEPSYHIPSDRYFMTLIE